MDIVAHLGKSDLFAGLGLEAIRLIAQRFEREFYRAGEIIFREGERGTRFYLIAAGEVAILQGTGISQRELGRMPAGQGFGEMALISREPRSATAQAMVDTELLSLDQEDFTLLLDQNEGFAQRMLRMISRRLKRADEVATLDLMRAHQGLIMSLAELADSRDAFTGAHLYRVRDYCTLLAKLMAQDRRYQDQTTPDFIEALYHVSPLHDIGKVAVPDSILMKKGKLTEEEFETIKRHPAIGAQAMDTVLEYCDLKMFRIARGLIWGHHERYDGQGYPQGLKGDAIPLEARIMAIADFYDALLSERAYKEAYGHERVIAAIRAEAGKRFDPAMAEIMLNHIEQFHAIHRAYADKVI
ncbi:MAG: cyclic nucleotide-binding domain-containing protein [Desulfobacterales bacterium]|nr:MAG: cyclic nucleotide-binding domain-containing protein [Desulfobacterales bacterium]